ncbi:hypothetical protein GQ53DRAFT_818169 [Thozetella sp. PMI_491]|nr:hypothetical protein GQ53DRAFT_818169 [Thozetella sp. PMI_491]
MKAATVFATITTFVLGSTAASVGLPRNQSPAGFDLYSGWDCASDGLLGHYEMSTEAGNCQQMYQTEKVQGIFLDFLYERCRFFVFENTDCSGSGQEVGAPGCLSDATGLLAYQLRCN